MISRAVALLGVTAILGGCAVGRQMLAEPGDLADYRAFRAAAHEGTRLARAQSYLEAHPNGRWAPEVRTIFDGEEAAFFAAAQGSRARAREYVVDLPRGPHIDAARALLVLFDAKVDDFDTLRLLADARRTEATLELASQRRHRVTEVISAELAALLDPAVYGSRIEEPPLALAAVLAGTTRVAITWGGGGGGPTARREDLLFFVVPTREGHDSRAAEVSLQLFATRGRVVEGRIEGPDLFVRWAEANGARPLDPNDASLRDAASASVQEVIAGVLEASLPASRCAAPKKQGESEREGEIMVRECDGWLVVVRMGAASGDVDSITVSRAREARMR
jgi:hypothetical protein